MNFIALSLILTIFVFLANGAEDDSKKAKIKVTYSTNRHDKWAFNKLPSTSKEAEEAGWIRIGGSKATCSNIGYRYILDDDPAVLPIYAENGQLVGLNSGFPESQMKSAQLKAWYKQQHMFKTIHPHYNTDETLYTFRVYFTDPDHVCDKHMKFEHNVYYFNETKKVFVPQEDSKLSNKIWQTGKCLPGKGDHYYDGLTKDMNCDHFQPLFLMYHHGKLVAISFVGFGEFKSNRYGADEYHPKSTYTKLVDVVPECLYKLPYNLTTLHVYFDEEPWTIDCKK